MRITASKVPVSTLLFSIVSVPLGFSTFSTGKLLSSDSTTRARAPYGARLTTTVGAGFSDATLSLVPLSEDWLLLRVGVAGVASVATVFSV